MLAACNLDVRYVGQVREQEMLRSQVDQLDKLLSDDNIELIPDFNRRLEVACPIAVGRSVS